MLESVIMVALLFGSAAEEQTWRDGIAAWRKKRDESVGGPEGWITLVARANLKVGENRIGGAGDNDIVLPHATPHIGSIFVDPGIGGDKLRLVVAKGAKVTVEGKAVTSLAISDDRDDRPTMMRVDHLVMHVIRRGELMALRVKDPDSPLRKAFHGLPYYPIDPKLRVRAHLEPAPKGKTLPILNVLDQIEQMECPGTLRFSIDGVAYALDAVIEKGGDDLFILFRDETSGHGTYGSGRFLHVPFADKDGNVELDFNRAYSPPCAYTPWATCPLPPKQNRLPRKIEAGEKYEDAEGHAPSH